MNKVIIDVEANPTIEFNTTTIINSLESTEALTLLGGSLEVVTASTMSGKLTLQGGDLLIDNALTLSGPLEWTSGEIHGKGTLNLKGNTTLSSTVAKYIREGVTVNNEGTFRVEDTGSIYGGEGTTFNNSGTFEFANESGTAHYYGNYYGDGTVFNNSGTIRKVGAGTATLRATLNNLSAAATIDVQAGVLELHDGGSSQGGTFTAASGASLDFVTGIYTLTGSYTGSGAGQVNLAGATFAGNGATLNFPNGGLGFTSGDITGPGALTLQGKFTASGTVAKYIREGATINNEGTFRIEDTGSFYGGEGTTFNNSGTFEFANGSGTAHYYGNYYGDGTVFNNSGTIRKVGAGTATLRATLNNLSAAATIDVQAGVLELHDGGSSQGGTFTAASGASLKFAEGTYVLAGSYTGDIAGQVAIDGATFAANGATLNFTNNGLSFLSGDIEGPGTFTQKGTFIASGTVAKFIRGATIDNEGTIRLGDSGTIYGGDGAVINNKSGATIEFAGSIHYDGNYHGDGTTFNNSGSVTKSGSGTPKLTACYNDSGTTDPGITISNSCP